MTCILVAVDGSPRSVSVIEAAVDGARARHERIVLFRSIGIPADVPQDLWKATDEPLLEVMRQRADAFLAECARSIPPDLSTSVAREVAVGVPWEAVCEAARRHGADLLVIGSHGYSGLDRLLGTTAAKIVNHAPCNVLVVRAGPQGKETGAASDHR